MRPLLLSMGLITFLWIHVLNAAPALKMPFGLHWGMSQEQIAEKISNLQKLSKAQEEDDYVAEFYLPVHHEDGRDFQVFFFMLDQKLSMIKYSSPVESGRIFRMFHKIYESKFGAPQKVRKCFLNETFTWNFKGMRMELEYVKNLRSKNYIFVTFFAK